MASVQQNTQCVVKATDMDEGVQNQCVDIAKEVRHWEVLLGGRIDSVGTRHGGDQVLVEDLDASCVHVTFSWGCIFTRSNHFIVCFKFSCRR